MKALQNVILAGVALAMMYLVQCLRQHRLRHANWPQLPRSSIWGHLRVIGEFIANGNNKRHIDAVFSEMYEALGKVPAFIVDLYPIGPLMCVVCCHEVAEQITKPSRAFPYSLPKAPTTRAFDGLFGSRSIVIAEGDDWSSLRRRFNPGFSSQNLVRLLPYIVEKTQRFIGILNEFTTSGEAFEMNELCTNLTFDIIGSVTLGIDLHAQQGKDYQNEMIRLFREICSTYYGNTNRRNMIPSWDFLRRRWLVHKLDVMIKNHIRQIFTRKSQTSNAGHELKIESRSILSLCLQDIDELTPELVDQICDQLKTFLFAGHDTTSILLQWAIYELSRTPHALNATCQELDKVFGSDTRPERVHEQLLSGRGKTLLSRLPYTSAVIKETLRLYPPSGTARYCNPGSAFTVRLPDGSVRCLDGLVLYNCESIIQRDEVIYGANRNVFVPERWLGNTDTSQQANEDHLSGRCSRAFGYQIPPSAWRPFERGPRNCIGQELANIEARVILASVIRKYQFTKVGLGEIQRDKDDNLVLGSDGQYEIQSQLYNKLEVTAKPVDGTKMRVRLAKE
ncbi:cytochrome P450 [Aspergillus sergii]|uniref:Cytochrome P450 n=1 Tax=Aspergillus sergii TaxID=1034303 RepID=A0A5N6WIU6_9EURO|nr:cytochrome P450 [Aspergillus sergii]